MEFTIQPILIPKYAHRIRIDVQVILAQKAIIQVHYFENGIELSPTHTEAIFLEGNEYLAWGNDDNYIKDLVFERLGLSLPREDEIIIES